MIKTTRTKREIVSVSKATQVVAAAEQRWQRAREASEAAEGELFEAQKALNFARRSLRDANRSEIERAKERS